MSKLTKALTMTAISAAAVGAFAVPANAVTNTGTTVTGGTDKVGHITGVCVTYGHNVNIVTVYNPTSPTTPLVVVSYPTVTGAKAC